MSEEVLDVGFLWASPPGSSRIGSNGCEGREAFFLTSRFVSWPFVFLGFSCFLVLSMLLVPVFRVSLFASVFLCYP